jgi:hypothetical protein
VSPKVGVRRVNLHSLRHAHATIGLENGVDLKTMSARLGHSRIAITADTYAHATRRGDADAAARDLSETAPLRVSDETGTSEHTAHCDTAADLRRRRVGGGT